MLPLLWLLVGSGIGAGAALVAKRIADTSVQLIPGQVWTLVAIAHQTKPWTNMSKGDVARAVRTALTGIGLIPIDAFWSGDYQLTVAISVEATKEIKPGTVLAINSEWSDWVTLYQINRAPAETPVSYARFP